MHGLLLVNYRFQKKIIDSIFLFLTGKLRFCRVKGNSMEPTISNGDLVIYKTVKAGILSIKKGSIVVAEHPLKKKKLLIKRVLNTSDFGAEIQGDNESSSDDSRKFGFISYDHILGIAKKIISRK